MPRIPDAYFSGGFGQARTEVMPQGRGAQMIGAAAKGITDTVQGIALDEIHYQGQQQLAQAHERKAEQDRLQREAEAEQKRLQREADKSKAMSSLVAHENALTQVAEEIRKDPAIPTADYHSTFRQQAENIKATFLESVPDEYKTAFAPSFEQHFYGVQSKLNEVVATEIRDTARGNLTTMMEELARSPKQYQQKLAILDESLANDDTWKAAGFGPDDKAKARQQFAEAAAVADIEALESSARPLDIMARLHAKDAGGAFTNWRELDPKTRESYYQANKSRHEQEQAEAERQRRERERQRKDDARDAYELYKESKEGLYPLTVKEEAALLRRMSGTNYEKRARMVRDKTTSIGFVTEKIKADPLTYGAARLGLAVPPLDPRTASEWPGQLQQRGEMARAIQQQFGLSFLPILTNQEAEGLAGIAKGQSPQGMVQLFKQIGTIPGMRGNTMRQVARQFDAIDPALGSVVGLIAANKPEAAFHVASGQQILGKKELPKAQADTAGRLFGQQMGDAASHLPRSRAALADAVTAAYVSLAAQKGLPADSIDKGTYADAFRSVVGETAKINGRRVVAPSGWTEGMLHTSMRKLTGGIVTAAGGVQGYGDPAAAAAAIRGDGQLYEAGDGVYRIAIDGRFLQRQDGGDFLLYFGGK